MNWLRMQWHKFRGFKSFQVRYNDGRINPKQFAHRDIKENKRKGFFTILFSPERM